MADLTITATSVLAQGGAVTTPGVAGAAITAGQQLYLDTTTGTWKLADANSGTAAARSPSGTALNGAAIGQPVLVQTSGPCVIGATLTAGVVYYLSATPGGIAPVADVTTGWYPTVVGIATSTTVLNIKYLESGVAL